MSDIYFAQIYKNAPKKASLSRNAKNALRLRSQSASESSEEREIRLRAVRSQASTSRAPEMLTQCVPQHQELLNRC